MRKCCIGIVVCNRWNLTKHTLNSLYYSEQNKNDYDLILINNGSDEFTSKNLKKYVESGLLPIKNLISIKSVSVSEAWNLFLSISRDYEYRIKMDNDVVLNKTIVASSEQPFSVKANSPQMAVNPLMGAPRSASVVKSAGAKIRKKSSNLNHSRFLEHLISFSEKNDCDLVSLVPVSPQETFHKMYSAVISLKRNGLPYLFGACMMINQKAFNTIKYFDERLPRRIDIEYSQRALRNGLNIGYHPFYGVTHIGARKSTESPDIIEMKYSRANEIENKEQPIQKEATSIWDSATYTIQKSCLRNNILYIK